MVHRTIDNKLKIGDMIAIRILNNNDAIRDNFMTMCMVLSFKNDRFIVFDCCDQQYATYKTYLYDIDLNLTSDN